MSRAAPPARRPDASAPPAVLRRPADAADPLPPMRQQPELAEVHARWAEVHSAPGDGASGARPDPAGGSGGSGLAGRLDVLRWRVAGVAGRLALPAQQEDRALIGSLIRATDALAVRCDELAGRVSALAEVVEDVVNVLSEDLTQIRAALAAREEDASPANQLQPLDRKSDPAATARSERPGRTGTAPAGGP